MAHIPSIGAMTLIAGLLAAPVLAQQSTETPPATTEQQPAAPAPAAATPQPVAPTSPAAPTGAMETSNPHLVIATVKLKNGWRASKLIGSGVYNDQNQKIGSIDDLILTRDDKVSIAVISVGGFLGIGNKLVAVPYNQLRFAPTKDSSDRVELPGATKEQINAMPNFTYSNS